MVRVLSHKYFLINTSSQFQISSAFSDPLQEAGMDYGGNGYSLIDNLLRGRLKWLFVHLSNICFLQQDLLNHAKLCETERH